MAKQEIVIGVIGAGRIGKLHVGNLKNIPNVRVRQFQMFLSII